MDYLVWDADGHPVTPDVLVEAYRQRLFPMADDREGAFAWVRPPLRAVVTWDRFRIPRSLRKTAARAPYRLTVDRAFDRVIAACAERTVTWLCRDLERLYRALYRRGQAHSVEAWDAEGRLVGGCYGLAVGGCFCGESMFHRADDAAKLCVLRLIAHLRQRGFRLLDIQQLTPHMERLGAIEIDDAGYERLFTPCLALAPSWMPIQPLAESDVVSVACGGTTSR